MKDACSVRRAFMADQAAVLAIERECAEASHWSERMWRSILGRADVADATRTVLVAERGGELVGFAVVQSAGGGAELENVAVRPEARRRGIAGSLCAEAMVWAARRGAAEMHLEVRAGNDAALRLYGALGFVEQGRRAGYYLDPREDAVVMMRALEAPLR